MVYSFDEDSGDVTFCCNEMGIFSVNHNNNNLDNNFDEDDTDTIMLIRIFGFRVNFKKAKQLKKS